MKKAVVYYSMDGNTEFVAKYVAEKLCADIIKIEPEKAFPDKGFKKFFWGGKSAVMGDTPTLLQYSFNPDEYDTVVIGTPVWAGSFTPPVRSFLNENKESVKTKKIAVFACCSGGGADKAIEKLKKYVGVNEIAAELVLIDPKDKPREGNMSKIDEFCSKIN